MPNSELSNLARAMPLNLVGSMSLFEHQIGLADAISILTQQMPCDLTVRYGWCLSVIASYFMRGPPCYYSREVEEHWVRNGQVYTHRVWYSDPVLFNTAMRWVSCIPYLRKKPM